MSNAHRLALLLLPTAIFAFGAACDSLKPVELEQQGNDTAAGSNPDKDTADTTTGGGPGSSGGGPGSSGGGTSNTPPRSNAGTDQAGVAIGDVAFLDGTGSTDADGDSLTYAWTFDYRVPGSSATISNASSPTATVYLDKAGQYSIKLTVTDSAGESDDDVVYVTVEAANGAPVADAGIDQSVSLGQLVQLSGLTSSDPNPNDAANLTFQWTFVSKPGGSVTQLSGDQTPTPRFTADVTGVYTVSLTVSDGTLDSAPDLVTINVTDPTTSGGSGSSNSGDCLSCSSEDAARRFAAGDAANGLLIGALPLLALLVERRRRR